MKVRNSWWDNMDNNKNEVRGFHPSPTMKVRFGDGSILVMNRATRRRNKIFKQNLRIIPRPFNPPNIKRL